MNWVKKSISSSSWHPVDVIPYIGWFASWFMNGWLMGWTTQVQPNNTWSKK